MAELLIEYLTILVYWLGAMAVVLVLSAAYRRWRGHDDPPDDEG